MYTRPAAKRGYEENKTGILEGLLSKGSVKEGLQRRWYSPVMWGWKGRDGHTLGASEWDLSFQAQLIHHLSQQVFPHSLLKVPRASLQPPSWLKSHRIALVGYVCQPHHCEMLRPCLLCFVIPAPSTVSPRDGKDLGGGAGHIVLPAQYHNLLSSLLWGAAKAKHRLEAFLKGSLGACVFKPISWQQSSPVSICVPGPGLYSVHSLLGCLHFKPPWELS